MFNNKFNTTSLRRDVHKCDCDTQQNTNNGVLFSAFFFVDQGPSNRFHILFGTYANKSNTVIACLFLQVHNILK